MRENDEKTPRQVTVAIRGHSLLSFSLSRCPDTPISEVHLFADDIPTMKKTMKLLRGSQANEEVT